MKIRLYLIIFGMIGILKSAAQEKPYSFTKIIPPSPSVYAMSKYGDLPVGLITGTAQYNIPLFKIQSGVLQAEISLDYSTNGVKVDEVPGRNGMNWNLSAGAVISRTVRGLPDGFGVTPLRPSNHNVLGDEFWSFLRNSDYYGNNDFDTQPDLFTISGSGVSGQFILENGVVKEIKKSGYKIEYTSGLLTFKITTPDGIEYYFGENLAVSRTNSFEEGETKNGAHNKAITAWFLNKIVGVTGDVINFNYTFNYDEVEYFSGMSNTYYPVLPDQTPYYAPIAIYSVPIFNYQNQFILPESKSFSKNAIEEAILNSITFPNGHVEFSYSKREDLINDKRLDSISLFGVDNQKIKSFGFGYAYSVAENSSFNTDHFYNTKIQDDYPYLKKRLFLLDITERGNDLVEGQKYIFEYDNINDLPGRLSYSQDLFGYFNGKVNEHFFPNDTYIDEYLGWNRFGGDRSFDFSSAKKGSLKRIINPLKGTIEIEYEANIVPNQQQRDISITTSSASMENSQKNDVVFSNDIVDALGIDINVAPTWYYPNTQPSGRDDEGVYVTLLNTTDNQIVFNHQLVEVDHDETFNFSGATANPTIFPGKIYKVKFESGANEISFSATITIRRGNILSDVEKPMAGLRVKSVATDDGAGNVIKKNYSYLDLENPNKSSGILYGGDPQHLFVGVERFEYNAVQNGNINGARTAGFVLQSNSVFDLYQSDIRGVLYKSVTETWGDNEIGGGIEHKYNISLNTYARPLETEVFPDGPYSVYQYTPIYISGVPSTNSGFLNGKEIYSGIFKSNNGIRTFLKKSYNFYSIDNRSFDVDTFYVVKRAIHTASIAPPNPIGEYDVNRYIVNHYWEHLDSTKNVSYDGGVSLSTNEKYEYGNIVNYLPTKQISEKSDGGFTKSEFRFPVEMVNTGNDPSGVYQRMINRNIINPIIDESKANSLTNVVQESIRKTYFEPFTGIFLPFEVSTLNLESSLLEPRLSFLGYNVKGRLLSQSQKSGFPVCYIYSYNNELPIAEITNANYTNVESLLGGQTAIENFSNLANPDKTTIDNFLAPLKANLANSLITTYTYMPLVGMTSQTDAKGITTYYEYDNLQRLKNIKDQNGYIIKSYDHHYKP